MIARRRTLVALRTELAEAHQHTIALTMALAEERRAHKAELDAMALRAAQAEAKAVRLPGVCPDRATCLSNTSAATAWRRDHPAYGGGIGDMPA